MPYLYSSDQVHALFNAAGSVVPPQRAATFQTLIGLLAVTGMRAGEAIRADVADLDLAAAALIVRGAKFGKSRRLPLHPSVVDALGAYLRLRTQRSSVTTTALLVTAASARLTYTCVHRTFKKLTIAAGVGPRSPVCRPRLHDLFATRPRSTPCWRPIRAAPTPAARLPLLSTYLGHTEPANNYWYLHAARGCWPWPRTGHTGR